MLWNLQVKGIHVHGILRPRQWLTRSRNLQSCQIPDRSVGRMVGGHPFGVIKSERPGLRSDLELSVQDFMRYLGCVHRDAYGTRRLGLSLYSGQSARSQNQAQYGVPEG